MHLKAHSRDFPGGPLVKNPPCSVGDVSLMSGWGTKIPCNVEQLSPRAATKTQFSRICIYMKVHSILSGCILDTYPKDLSYCLLFSPYFFLPSFVRLTAHLVHLYQELVC